MCGSSRSGARFGILLALDRMPPPLGIHALDDQLFYANAVEGRAPSVGYVSLLEHAGGLSADPASGSERWPVRQPLVVFGKAQARAPGKPVLLQQGHLA